MAGARDLAIAKAKPGHDHQAGRHGGRGHIVPGGRSQFLLDRAPAYSQEQSAINEILARYLGTTPADL